MVFAKPPSFCFSYQLLSPNPCCNHPTSRARYTSRSSKINEAHENEIRKFGRVRVGDLRFSDRLCLRFRLLCLDFGLDSLLSLLRCISNWGSLGLAAIRRCPEGEVVSEKLHDQCAVTVRFLGQRVELSDSIIESLLGKMASTIGGVQDLVVEDGEVEG